MVSGTKSVALDWDGAGMPEAPAAPETIKQAGLTLSVLDKWIEHHLVPLAAAIAILDRVSAVQRLGHVRRSSVTNLQTSESI